MRKDDYTQYKDLYEDQVNAENRDMQVFITYKIKVTNKSQTESVTIPELVDYYDTYQFEDPTTTSHPIIEENMKRNSGISFSSSGYSDSIDLKQDSRFKFGALYIHGIGTLGAGSSKYVYVTFKVKNDPDTGRVRLDQKINGVTSSYGAAGITKSKKNIAEINCYETDNGLIDQNSNPGSLRPRDLDDEGNIIVSETPSVDRQENDSDQAGNLYLKLDTDDAHARRIKGYVFEDARTNTVSGAVIGNGTYNVSDKDVYNNADKKVNGVKVELVELVQKLDENGYVEGGYGNGTYIEEKVWASYTYGDPLTNPPQENTDPYYSGSGLSRVILSGPAGSDLEVKPDQLETHGEGEYEFKSFPPGDYFIRFTYGDTSRTVLINDTENEVNKVMNGDTDWTLGENAISYTGQDYKSTIYQAGMNQNISYNGINGFTDYEKQNYFNGADKVDQVGIEVPPKNQMYYYDVETGENTKNVSDAKDVYAFREREMNYSKGSSGNSSPDDDDVTLKNHKSDVLASGTSLTTEAKTYLDNSDTVKAKEAQKNALSELSSNTYMVAQTGVMHTKLELDKCINEKPECDNDAMGYKYYIDDLDFGITERPEAQLALSKGLTHIKITLGDQNLFDTGQSMSNLMFQSHYTRDKVYDSTYKLRLRQELAKEEAERLEELVKADIDEELLSGARVELTYTFRVDNIGEVDYSDKIFYYLGTRRQ